MKLKNKTFAAVTLLGISALAITVISTSTIIQEIKAEPALYTITFSKDKNTLDAYVDHNDNHHLETDLGSLIKFYFWGIESIENGWGTSIEGVLPQISNHDRITGLKSVKITTLNSPTVSLYFDYGMNGSYSDFKVVPIVGNEYFMNFETEANGFDMVFADPNYKSVIQIKEMVISYTC